MTRPCSSSRGTLENGCAVDGDVPRARARGPSGRESRRALSRCRTLARLEDLADHSCGLDRRPTVVSLAPGITAALALRARRARPAYPAPLEGRRRRSSVARVALHRTGPVRYLQAAGRHIGRSRASTRISIALTGSTAVQGRWSPSSSSSSWSPSSSSSSPWCPSSPSSSSLSFFSRVVT